MIRHPSRIVRAEERAAKPEIDRQNKGIQENPRTSMYVIGIIMVMVMVIHSGRIGSGRSSSGSNGFVVAATTGNNKAKSNNHRAENDNFLHCDKVKLGVKNNKCVPDFENTPPMVK